MAALPNDAARPGSVQRYADFSVGSLDFIERNGLWSDVQRKAAAEIESQLADLGLVRVAYSDPHGLARSKTLTTAAFRTALRNGLDASPGPFVFDTGHAVAVDFFADGGGVDVAELTGAGDFILVPDPLTFRRLPRSEANIGWIIGDEYLRDGTPHPLSSRSVLKRQMTGLMNRRLDLVVGLEIEWTLTRVRPDDRPLIPGGFGIQAEPPVVEPVNAGYQFNLDMYIDQLLPVIAPLTRALESAGLPLRTVEHESGPGQLELTFSPMSGLAAADAVLLIRAITKQVCASLGYHASFMALPRIVGLDPSGWHLHQSLYDLSGKRNAFASGGEPELLSQLGRHYVGGLLEHAANISLLCVPSINGYRRFADQFSLAPDRILWSPENRGAFVRVLGAAGDPATHVENRTGEPCANPYLYIAAQVAAGLDGIDRRIDPGLPARDPHDVTARPLPRSLSEALAALETGGLARDLLGLPLWQTLLMLKQSELRRFQQWAAENDHDWTNGSVTEWEHREYFEAY